MSAEEEAAAAAIVRESCEIAGKVASFVNDRFASTHERVAALYGVAMVIARIARDMVTIDGALDPRLDVAEASAVAAVKFAFDCERRALAAFEESIPHETKRTD